MNQSALIAATIILFYPPVYWSFGHPYVALLTLAVSLGFFSIPLINRCSRQGLLGRIVYFGLCYVSISLFSVLIGRGAGLHLFLISLVAAPFSIIDIRRRRAIVLSFLIPMSLLLFLELYAFDAFAPLDFSLEARRLIYLFVLPSVVTTSFVGSGYFYLTNIRSEQKLRATIQDLKVSQAKIEEQKLQLASASRLSAIGELSGNIAHEINNPLAIIKGFAEQMAKALQSEALDRQRLIDWSRKINETVMRISKIVLGLRKLSRDGDSDRFETVDISSVVEDALSYCSEGLLSAEIQLQVVHPSAASLCLCRPLQISQVILNLVQNAKDAVMPISERWIRIETIDTGSAVAIRVSNSGALISPEVVARIGEPFFTTKPAGSGTGLGLSISHKIIMSHNGSLTLDLEAEHTTFVVYLPKGPGLTPDMTQQKS